MLRVPEAKKDVNAKTAQLVRLVSEIGPDIPEISRRLGQFRESVRYRYKEKLLTKGFAVQAMPDHERLGLQRVVVVVDFSLLYSSYAQTVLTAMSELCYVVGFAKTLPEGKYVVSLSVPRGHLQRMNRLLNQLRATGLFQSLEIFSLEWFRNVPMRGEFFDFNTGRWEFDWSKPFPHTPQTVEYPPTPARFDYIDLLLIKELQKDANKSLKEISEELEVNYKKLAWHFNTHVTSNRLIRGYRVNWMGTKYDFKIDRALHRKHRYLAIDVFAKNLSDSERAILGERANRVPFLWAEAGGRDYVAEFFFPLDYVVEGLQFLADTISDFKGRAKFLMLDQANAVAFSIPYELFDASRKEWAFDERELSARFSNLVQEIKKGTG